MYPLVSVIIPVFNSEKYLDKCITSVLNQNFSNLEVILIDDGSTDNSGTICDKYAKQDKRIVVKHIPNGGVSNARNIGIDISSGEYISFIDSDDYINENYIKELYNNLIETSSQLSLCPIKVVSNEGAYIWNAPNSILNFSNIDKELFINLNENFLLYGPVNKLYVSKVIKKNKIKFDINISYGEDLIFNFNYYKYIDRISITNSVYYSYVQDNIQSLSKKYYENKFENGKIIHYCLLDFFKSKNLTDSQCCQLLYGRLFDDVYNSMFLINHPMFNKGMRNKIAYIKSILNDNELGNCLKYADTSIYSKKIIYIIKSRSALLFLLYNFLSKTVNKVKIRKVKHEYNC